MTCVHLFRSVEGLSYTVLDHTVLLPACHLVFVGGGRLCVWVGLTHVQVHSKIFINAHRQTDRHKRTSHKFSD
jgi:hypothetical protein